MDFGTKCRLIGIFIVVGTLLFIGLSVYDMGKTTTQAWQAKHASL